MLSESDMRQLLRWECRKAGSAERWVEANGFGSKAFIYAVIRGEKPVSERLAGKLGYRRVTVFEEV